MARRNENVATARSDFKLWLWWVVVHIVAYAAGVGAYRLFTSYFLPNYADELWTRNAYSYEAVAIVAGTIVGIILLAVGQGLILKRCAPEIGGLRWSIATFIGYLAGFILLVSFSVAHIVGSYSNPGPPRDSVGLGEQSGVACLFLGVTGAMGAIAGFAQGRLLTKSATNQDVLVIANAIALPAFMLFFALTEPFRVISLGFGTSANLIFGAALGGTLAGAISGLVIVRLVPRKVYATPSPASH